MKKKWWVLVLGIILCVVVWLTIPTEETYGEGYSEERRRQWNERAEKIYLSYMGYIPPEKIVNFVPPNWEDEAFDLAEETMEGNYLPERKAKYAGGADEEWMLKIFPKESVFALPDEVNLSALPESGWTEEELAKAGKLHLAERPFMINAGVKDGDKVQQMIPREAMLALYRDNGGQLYDFLFKIWMDKARDREVTAAWHIAQQYHYGHYQEDREKAIRDTLGYGDFLKEVDEGNYEMYYLFKSLIGDKYVPNLESRLRPALGKKARTGDASAQRQLGKCMVDAMQGYLDIIYGINHQYSQIVPWNKYLFNKLPVTVQHWFGPSYEDPTYKDYKGRWRDLPIYHDYEEGLSWCLKAANKGDMEAKFLWVSGSPYMPRFYSREEWERSLEYTRELLEKGYASMLLAVVMRRDLPFHFYYPREHRQSIMEAARSSLMERGCYYLLVMDAVDTITPDNINSQESMEKVKRICQIFPTAIMRVFSAHFMKEPGAMKEFLPYIEQSAGLGERGAMYFLKHFYKNGRIVEKDEVKKIENAGKGSIPYK